jgi:hypothetical protein
MIQDTEPTNVSFYLATYEPREADEQPTKEVLAVFGKNEFGSLEGYAHLGQHCTLSQSFLAEKCKKIEDQEMYLDLYNELLSLGYNLEVV